MFHVDICSDGDLHIQYMRSINIKGFGREEKEKPMTTLPTSVPTTTPTKKSGKRKIPEPESRNELKNVEAVDSKQAALRIATTFTHSGQAVLCGVSGLTDDGNARIVVTVWDQRYGTLQSEGTIGYVKIGTEPSEFIRQIDMMPLAESHFLVTWPNAFAEAPAYTNDTMMAILEDDKSNTQSQSKHVHRMPRDQTQT